MTNLDALWQRVRIGAIETRNRIYLPAHQPSLAPRAYGAYLAERARGGVGLIVMHGFHVHPSSARGGAESWEPAWAESVRAFVSPAKSEGCPVLVQITHMGASGNRRTDDIGQWGSLLAASAIPSPLHRAVPKSMEAQDIAEVIRGLPILPPMCRPVAATAWRSMAPTATWCPTSCRRGGTRDDHWGDDTERRTRLALESAACASATSSPANTAWRTSPAILGPLESPALDWR